MNIQEAWAYGRLQLAHASSFPDLDARLLLEYLLQVGHSFLVAFGEKDLTLEQELRYRLFIQRAKQKEPIPYITGMAQFYGLDICVNPSVLIPRPETEQLVECALAWAKSRQPLQAVDVGTGSGCIAVCLAKHLPCAGIFATDISSEALEVARKNAAQYVPGRVGFYEGNLLTPFPAEADLIIANLPYVSRDEWTMVDDGVKWYEPTIALIGGSDGLDLISELLQQAMSKLRPGGAIFLEVGWQQGQAVVQLARKRFPSADVALIADYAGQDRIVSICTG